MMFHYKIEVIIIRLASIISMVGLYLRYVRRPIYICVRSRVVSISNPSIPIYPLAFGAPFWYRSVLAVNTINPFMATFGTFILFNSYHINCHKSID